MIKLIKILSARLLVGEKIPNGASAEVISIRRRQRRPLICVWIKDPETGRLVCSWKPPADDQHRAQDAGRPPPAICAAA